MSIGAVPATDGPPRRGRWARLADRLSTAAWIALLVVLATSVLAFLGGLVFLEWTVFTIGVIGFVGVCVFVDFVIAASLVVEGDDPRQRRTRRRLAVFELVTILACFGGSWYVAAGWDVFVTFPEQIAFGLLWTGSAAVTVIAFRAMRRERGISEPPAPPSYHPEDSPEVAERFWSERTMRRRWWTLHACSFVGGAAILAAAVAIGGDNPTTMGLVLFGLMIPWLCGVAALHRHWNIPVMAGLPPLPLPEAGEVPHVVRFRPRLNVVRILAILPVVLVPAYVPLLFEVSSGDAAVMSHGAAVTLTVVGGVIVVGTLIAAVWSGRLAVEVSPDGLRIVNFFNTHAIAWAEAAAVDAAPQRITTMLAIGAAGAVGQDVTLSASHPLCVRLRDAETDPHLARPIRATATSNQDPQRSKFYGEFVVAVRREAEAHGVPVRF